MALARLWKWWPGSQNLKSVAGDEASLGKDLVFGHPRRQAILSELKELQTGLPLEDREDLIDPVVTRFASYVVDLPASESHHDALPYGLLDHSLEAALHATRELVRPSFRASEDPNLNYRDQPRWAFAGFVLGLLHDAGKILDLEVVLPGDRLPWNPLAEPLAAYLGRYGERASGLRSWNWSKGRGDAHTGRVREVSSRILASRARLFLAHRWDLLLKVFGQSHRDGQEDWGVGPAGRVVAAVRRADHAAAKVGIKDLKDKKANERSPSSGVRVPHSETAQDVETIVEPAQVEPTSSEKAANLAQASHAPASGSPNSPRQEEDPAKRAARELAERNRQVEAAFQPQRIREAILSLLRSGNAPRNSPQAEIYVREDHLWMRYPEGTRSLVEEAGITWSSKVGERLLAVLLKFPELAPENPGSALVYACAQSKEKQAKPFVRFHARRLLNEKELASLGYWPYEMKISRSVVIYEQGTLFKPPLARGA